MSDNFDFNSLSTTPAAKSAPKPTDTTSFDFNSLATPPPSTIDKVGSAISDAASAGLSSVGNVLDSAQQVVRNAVDYSGLGKHSVMDNFTPAADPRSSQPSPVAPVNQAYFDKTKAATAGQKIPDALKKNQSAIARTVVASDQSNQDDAANTIARAKGQDAPGMTDNQMGNAALVKQTDNSPSLKDQYLSLGQGLVSAAQLPFTANTIAKNLATDTPVNGILPYVANKAADALGINKFDPAEALNDVNNWLGSQHSDQYNAEQKKPILSSQMQGVFDDGLTNAPGKLLHTVMNDPVFGRGATSLSKVDGTILQSLPSSVASMFPVMRASRIAYEAGIASGAGEQVAQHAAEHMAMKIGASSEGIVGGLQQWQQTYDQVMGMPESTLQNSAAYQEALKYSNKDDARKHVATNAANVAGATAAAVDAPLAALGDRYLGTAAAGKGTRLGSVARGIAQETPTETLQSMGEQLGTNLGVQQYANPNQKLGDQVMEQGAQGGISGGLMGGGMGGMSHVNTPSEHQQVGEALNQDVAGANFDPQDANQQAIQALSPNNGITPAAQTRSFLPTRPTDNAQVSQAVTAAPSTQGNVAPNSPADSIGNTDGGVPTQAAIQQASAPASDTPSNALDSSALLDQIDQPDATTAPSAEAIASVSPETQALWSQVVNGMTTSANGVPSAYLQAGNVLHQAGIINNAVDFNSVVKDIKAVQAIGLPEAARQSAIKGVVKKYIAAAKPSVQAAPANTATNSNMEPVAPVSPEAPPAATDAQTPSVSSVPSPPAKMKRNIPVNEGRDSLVGAIIKMGGINSKYMKDVTGESLASKARAPIGLFTTNGHGLDNLATELAAYGYPVDTQGTDGGVSHLSELVNASLGGDHVYTPIAQEAMLAKFHQQAVKEQAKELGIRTVARKFSDIERDLLTLLTKKDEAEAAKLDSDAAEAFTSAKAELVSLLDQNDVDVMIDPIADKASSIREFYKEATSQILARIERIMAARAEPDSDPFGDSSNDSQVLEGNASQAGQSLTGEAGTRHEAAGVVNGTGSNAAPDGLELTGQTSQEIAAEEAAAEREKKRKAAEDATAEAAAKKARTDKEIASRQHGSADNFQLGQSAEESLSGQGDVFNQPAPSKDQSAKEKAQADLDAGLADLADIFGKNFKANIVPEQEQKLLPVLAKVMDAAFRLGHIKFKDAARFVLQTIRAKIGKEVADQISLDHLQGSYISMAGKYAGQGADTKRAVIDVESLAEIEPIEKTNIHQNELYQWARNKEGGQESGNQQEIKQLTPALFEKYIKPITRADLNTFNSYHHAFPGLTHISIISKNNGKTWILGTPAIGTIDELRPKPKHAEWVKKVDSFSSMEAKQQSATSDSESAGTKTPLADELKQNKAKKESALDAALRSVGLDPNAPVDKEASLRRQADKLMKESMAMLDGIQAGQPVRSTADRNRRERSMEKARKATDLLKQADELKAHKEQSSPAISVDAAAHEAATSPHNDLAEPSQAMKEAGNYKLGHVTIGGMDISIENPAGSTRSGTDASGKAWAVQLEHHYGYLKGTIGRDKEHIDVFVKPGLTADYSGPVFVIDQKKPGNGNFDEHKVVLGASTKEEATAIYRSNYEKGWDGVRSISEFSLPQFKDWLAHGDTTAPAADYNEITAPDNGQFQENANASSAGRDSEQHRQDANAAQPVGAKSVLDEPAGIEPAGSGAIQPDGSGRNGQHGSQGIPGSSAAADGEHGDQQVHSADRTAGTAVVPARNSDSQRSDLFGEQGVYDDSRAADAVKGASESAQSLEKKIAAQRDAETIPIVYGDRANIDETFPFLSIGQREDVHFSEKRLGKPDGYGVLFTNGTGTGKTYLGLGIAKRMVRQGKSNGLIVVPNDKMVEDWTDSAKNLGLTVRALDGVKDPGKGIAVTTYANFGQNLTLADRPIDWVITDESHNLMQNAQASDTESLNALQAITLHPDGVFVRARMLHRDLYDRLDQTKETYTALSKARKDMTDVAELKANGIATEAAKARHDAILKEWTAKVEEVKSHIAAHQGKDRPRVVMLSATPFAYEKNVALAAGYLYQLGDQNTSGAYNTPSPMDAFMIQHFGYRMRFGKLTQPDANVDSGLMQRQFNTYLRKEGVLSARILDVDHDYDRKFVLIPSAIGRKIDEGLEYLREEAGGRYYPLYEAAQKKFDYLSRLRLLEALKAEAAVSYIKEHHVLGRKVVVFHDYNDGGAFNPFSFSHMGDDNTVTSRVKNAETGAAETATVKVNDLINEFNAKRPDLADINLNGFSNPIATLTRAFPDAMQFNGRIPKKDRRFNIQQFNDDNNPNANLLIVQSAANAGWSGHDTTGKHQRVVLNLGLPTAPTKAIQQEGRIYRVGQASDAMFRYMNTGTSWERMAFASTIARRASAAENMAMGEQARGLLASFIGAFEDSSEYPASKEDGKGGKALDRALAAAMSDFERAKTFYFGQQKKTSRNKSAEGADYFATPEPIGQKMVEWLDARGGDSFLEPSAGHAAIARWFPEHHPRTIVEPSMELASRAALLTDAKLINDKFENLNTINKYDLIAMNPPFGVGGKTAIEHLDKAFKHLNDGGRIVALIPVGQTADKHFDEWMHGTKKAPVKPIGKHPTLGPIYKGDTLKVQGYGDTAFIADRVTKDGYVDMETKGGLSIHELLTSDRIAEIKPTGTRTREVANAPHAYLRGDILLPAATFNRAGTGVMTRIVIIDKVAYDKLSMGLQQSSTRDLTDAKNINDLFDRIENMTALPRVEMPEKEQAREASQAKPAIQAKESVRQQDAQALQREAQVQQSGAIAAQGEAPTFEVQGDKLLTNAPAVTVTTAKGKELMGVLVQDKEMAKGIDKFTYKPQGMDGYLVRMRHVIRPEEVPSFSHAEDSAEASPLPPSKDQTAANKLNSAMVGYFKNSDWSHAYDQVQLPDHLHGLEQAVKAAFGTEVVAIVPTAQRFNAFNGINYGGINYINVQSNRGFINVVGHELYHEIKKSRPDLHAWFSDQAKQFYQNVPAYSDKLDALLQPGESKMSADAVEEELLADFTGDAIADTEFVAGLAKQEPTKFRQLLKLVTGWLKDVAGKLSGKGFGSSEYFTDVQALRNHLNKMLLAYASGKSIEGMAEFTAPKFSTNESEIKGNQAAASSGSTTAAGWKMLAGDMGIFKNLTPDSFDMEGAAREIDPGMRAFSDKPDLEEEKNGIVQKWHITMPDKEPAFVQENNKGEVWVDAHHLASGSSGGTKLYLLVGSYAEANGKVFIGDPAGLSDIALIRRTENMLSLALRFGKTSFMMPHEYQMNPAAKHDSVLDKMVRPINWVVGDDKNNLNELLKTSQANTTKLMPEIKDVFYNFENGQFEKDGKRFTDFGGILQRGNDSLLQRGFSKILTGNNGATDGSPGERAPVGVDTLKRTAVTNTLSRAARSGGGGGLLAQISRIIPRGLTGTPLEKILYSRADHNTVAEPTSTDHTDPYGSLETRPNTRPEQLAAGRGAMADAERRIIGPNISGVHIPATLLGSAISADFRKDGGTSLVGQVAKTPQDLAFLAQVLRDPRFETFRFFYTDPAGNVIGERVYSSRLAGLVYIDPDMPEYIKSDMASIGAAGYWMLHNHPSGSAKESKVDLETTTRAAREIPGFLGHVIIDNNEYNHISIGKDGEAYGKIISAPELASIDLHANHEKPHPLLGVSINASSAVANIGKQLQKKDGYVTLIGTDTKGKVALLTEVPDNMLRDMVGKKFKQLRAIAAVKRALRETGSMNIFAAVPGDLHNYQALSDSGLFRDVVSLKNNSSAATMGLINTRAHHTAIEMRGGKAGVAEEESAYSHNAQNVTPTLTRTDPLFDNPKQADPVQSPMDLKGGALGDNSTWNTPDITRLDTVIHALQDKHIDMKRVIQSIKQADRSIADSANPYLQEELFHGRSAKRVEDFINHELTPLTTDMRARNISSADFEHYLWARHAEERNIQIAKINPEMPDGGSGMDTKEANDYLDNLTDSQKRGFEELAKRVDAITAATRQTLVDYGLETKTTTDTWGNAYKHYVPLMREDMDHGFGNGTGQGYSIKGNSAKRATGSSRNVIHILANIAMQRERAIVRGEKNRVATAVVALAKLNPNPGFWETEKPPTIRAVSDVTGMVEDRVDHNYRNRDNVVVARINNGKGKIIEHAVVFNEHNERAMRMVASLKNLDVNPLDSILSSSAVITRYFSAINTQYNPVFGIVNLIRDVQDASLNLSSTPIAGKQLEVISHVLPALMGMYSDIRKLRKGEVGASKWAHLAEEYESEGGKTGFRDMFRNSADRAEAIEQSLNPDWWQTTKLGKAITLGGLLNMPEKLLADHAVRPLFNWLSDYNDAMENATRLAAYKVSRDNGMNKQQSASLAKNISVNFNRKGSKGQQMGALYSFFNAAVQGTARMAETLAGPAGKRIIAGGVLFGVMQAVMMAMAGFDSEDDEPPEFIKARNTIIPTGWVTGKHDYISIPMPLGFNILPNIGRLSAEYAIAGFKDTGKYASNLVNAVIDSMDPISNAGMSMQSVLPTVFDPFAALAENKDWTGRPIARTDFNSLHPTPGFTRTKDTASYVGKKLAKTTNWITFGTDYTPGALSPTPDQIDYLISQVTGGVGREFSKVEQVSSALYNSTFDEVPTYKIPLAGRLYGNADGQASQGSKFYDNIIRLNGYEGEIKGRAKNGQDVAKFIRENPEAKLVGAAISSEKQVSALRKHRHKLFESNAPHDRLKTVDSQITAVMKRLNEQVKKARTEAAQ